LYRNPFDSKKTNHPAGEQQGDPVNIDHFSKNASFFIPFLADGQIRLTGFIFNRISNADFFAGLFLFDTVILPVIFS